MGEQCQVGKEASVYLSAVLEHITGAMLKEASGESRNEQSNTGLYTRIGPKHIKATLSKNGDLKQLANTVTGNTSNVSQLHVQFSQHSPPPSPKHKNAQDSTIKHLQNDTLQDWSGILTCIGFVHLLRYVNGV